jgi:O-antigen/teichoic acid export membrane protein
LGFYERAHSFNQYPASILTGIISKVSFPLLSKIKSDQNRVARIYKQILQFTFFISAPLFLFAAVLAQPLFDLILGEEWAMSATFFQIFCFSFMLYPVQAFNINVLMVYGRSDLFLRLEIIKKSIILISIIISLPFGIYVLVWSSLVVALLALIINTYYSAKMINYNLTSQLRDLFPFLIFAALSAFIMYLSTLLMDFNSLFLQIFSVGLIGVICYLILNSIFKTSPMQLVIKTIKDKIL